jgi:hypothetical protein
MREVLFVVLVAGGLLAIHYQYPEGLGRCEGFSCPAPVPAAAP